MAAVVVLALGASALNAGQLRPMPMLPHSSRAAVSCSASSKLSPLYEFAGERAADTLEQWERIDDVIMGGVSSSRLVAGADGDGASFEGTVREQGGGFAGQRVRLLAEPLDLSKGEGLYLDCEADAESANRVYKMALRTKQDRGEVVYQARFSPPALERSTIMLPFDSFRLVRGPRIVEGVPPLSAAAANATFQISIIVSKFTISGDGASLPNFKEGRFRLKLFELGLFGSALEGAVPVELPRALSEAEQRAARPLPLKLMGPLLGVLFGEQRRRRKAATALLEARGYDRLARARFAWNLRRAGGRNNPLLVAWGSAGQLLQDALIAALSLPLQLLFKTLFGALRLLRRAKRGRGAKDGPPGAPAPSAA